jgi:hypothetical protein
VSTVRDRLDADSVEARLRELDEIDHLIRQPGANRPPDPPPPLGAATTSRSEP